MEVAPKRLVKKLEVIVTVSVIIVNINTRSRSRYRSVLPSTVVHCICKACHCVVCGPFNSAQIVHIVNRQKTMYYLVIGLIFIKNKMSIQKAD